MSIKAMLFGYVRHLYGSEPVVIVSFDDSVECCPVVGLYSELDILVYFDIIREYYN